MSNELLFHLISLAIIAIITILPAFYILEKRKNKNNSFIIKNRRDIFKPWIMLSSIYIGIIVENNKSVIAGILIGLAWFILFSILIYWPLFFKQPEGERYGGWILKYNNWLEYPNKKQILATTYSSTGNCSTIGAGELNCRVRDGNGCDLSAIVTRKSYYLFCFYSSLKTAQG